MASAFDLTTVEQDARALAEVAVQALVARIGLSTGGAGGTRGDGAGGTRGDGPGATGAGGPALPAGVLHLRCGALAGIAAIHRVLVSEGFLQAPGAQTH